MQISKILTAFMSCNLFALTFFLSPPSAFGRMPRRVIWRKQVPCQRKSGTYVLDTYYENEFAGKRVITLTPDNIFFAIDSNQGGTKGVPPGAKSFPNNRFTSGQGVWRCDRLISATTLKFNFPAPDSKDSVKTAQTYYRIDIDPNNGTLKGSFSVQTYPLKAFPEGSDKGVKENTYTFTFTGQKLDLLPDRNWPR